MSNRRRRMMAQSKVFHTKDSWTTHFKSLKDSPKLVVIDFMASWCGPCKVIAPLFADLAKRLTDVEFIKMDVDELKDVAQEFEVQEMPTFVFLTKGKELDRIFGAKKDELLDKIEKHRYMEASA